MAKKKKNPMPKDIALYLRELHEAQQKIVDESKRFNVVDCGRRWGKTELAINRLIIAAINGEPVAWFAPTNKMLAEAMREIIRTLEPIKIRVNVQEQRLDLYGGGSIDFWSLDSPDTARGRKYKLVVIDEAAHVKNLQEAWSRVIRPTLTDLKGGAWFLSTPNGMNYFKTLYDRGQDPEQEDWASWQMPTSTSPFIDAEEIAASRLDMSEADFNREFLAQFVDGEGSVFRHVNEAATIAIGGVPEAGHVYVIGCDWGLWDYTVFIVLDLTARKVVAMDRSNGMEYGIQCGRLKALRDKWKPRQVIAELNSVGRPIIEQLRRDGLRVQAFTTTNESKGQAIRALALAFERGDIQILKDPVLINELVAYQAIQLASGQTRYAAPSGQHDDCVMALAIAWTAVSNEGRLVYLVPDAEIVVPDFRIADFWPRAYGFVVMGNTVAAVWVARDPQSDKLYVYDEYLAEGDPAFHAANIRSAGDWIPGLMEPATNGRDQADGEQLIRYYCGSGLKLQTIDRVVEAGILSISQRLRSGLLKVFTSCEEYIYEKGLYRRDEGGRIVEQNNMLQDALRCAVNGISRMRTKPVPPPYYPPKEHGGGPRSWMSL
jgi:Terminase large subunit, T4likevirus-type, N-terminal/Terminase RNaseH-like domain